MPLPDFIIVGAQKSGTSSLYAYLSRHPMVAAAARKEVHYFDLNYHRSIEWYRAQFSEKPGVPTITGEASPYYLFHPLAAQRCASVVPDAKIIVLLRNPVDRAYSHYQHEVRRGLETLSFEDALDHETERLAGARDSLISSPLGHSEAHQTYSYLSRGMYADQLAEWMPHYRPKQMLILESESLFEDPAAEYRRVLDFLDLPQFSLGGYHPWNWGEYEPMAPQTRERLQEHFAPANQRLANSLGICFRWA